MRALPSGIPSGEWREGHCQGIGIDPIRGYAYFSFTTSLVKTDLNGNLIGSVRGLTGHLGCIVYDAATNRVYGSLEYKNDAIGKGILKRIGSNATLEDAFYMAVFDADAITRPDMDAARDGVMRAAYLKEVADDYAAEIRLPNGGVLRHRYGCSGIDGTAIGPMFGAEAGEKPYLFVAYGIYGDTDRTDNDHQVLLAYDLSDIDSALRPLSQEAPHHSGPEAPARKLFAYTGNTTYGIQNLEYDPRTRSYFAAVYVGRKPEFPNLPLYRFDAAVAPAKGALRGVYPSETGDLVSLASGAILDTRNGISGYSYPYGQTGLCSLGDGRFFVSYDGRTENGWNAVARLCEWDGIAPLRPLKEE